MQIESQIPLNSDTPLHQEVHQGDGGALVASADPNNVAPQPPVKKPTRQWAAWTHQEEESFFTALRQVGKNFEKITCRVQSKNKDQVRHYYYRLVRRMNKLLGPELSLDAKNSKDTNAAMLRWWSLLEKYSCKASKLHLKPRRFKIFTEALEHQLLKDRKKNVRKRPSQGESCAAATPSNVLNQIRETGSDSRPVKLVLVDSQNIQKLGAGKGSIKRNINIGVRTNNKGELTNAKSARQRRKPGVPSSAAYKKWEKAAIAGVSLVADAAEHLERTATDKETNHDQGIPGQKGLDLVEKPPLLSVTPHSFFVESNMHNVKLKLQLFPIDDATRRAMEMDKHNPHLELTLSSRKKISSVWEHLNRKWGNSSAALGELMLLPYSARKENLMSSPRWTQDSTVSAADVHAMVGSSSVFRLRYGWFSRSTAGSLTSQAPVLSFNVPVVDNMNVENRKRLMVESGKIPVPSTDDQSEKLGTPSKNTLTSVDKHYVPTQSLISMPMNTCLTTGPKDNSIVSATIIPWNRKETGNCTSTRLLEDADGLQLRNGSALSAGDWADSLTNISIGDLLSEVPHGIDADCVGPSVPEASQCLPQTPFSCDSFDAAIAAHISGHQSKMGIASMLATHSSSIWDAEETCDAFSFQKNPVLCPEVPSSSGIASPEICKQIEKVNTRGFDTVEMLPDDDECPPDQNVMDNSPKNFSALTEIYWPESLGPLDLDIPSTRYHSEDIILGDSLGGLNRLIASSLDAFQNCSFFGMDKKEHTSAVEPREPTSFADFKIGSEV
ncbi:TSL-kinase interacting protein 1 isoform X2 [Carica papaya]|uniref:TSL-kinase interacting protein 1 isoform X2 n=1 Tax=Carica papaya TaxID=3649 RepID=UPI000B8CCEB3|nr:TSL-kinase interacting protein 1 isoform X2 [Carica papaya]